MAEEDIELDEKLLLQLALQELKGKLPPGYTGEFGEFETNILSSSNAGSSKRTSSQAAKNLLSREMASRGWDFLELAARCNLPVPEVAALAKGSQKMSRDNAALFAKVFSTSVDFWLTGGDFRPAFLDKKKPGS